MKPGRVFWMCLAAVLFSHSACTPKRPIPEKADLAGLCQKENVPIPAEELIDRGMLSTVYIESVHKGPGCGPYSIQGGTGVIVDRQAGLILTAAHVVERTVKVNIATLAVVNGQVEEQDTMRAIVLARDSQTDVALLMVERQHDLPPALPVECRWIPSQGEPVVQFGRTSRISLGRVLRAFIRVDLRHRQPTLLVETTAVGEFGDSGGPVLNRNGRLIGILVMKSESRRTSIYVPLDQVIRALDGPIKR